jgi:hypothetical protein
VQQATFLQELAQSLYQEYGTDLSHQTIIFPNKRAGLFFNQALKQLLKQPIWGPEVMSFEELVKEQSVLSVPDKITLIFRMHEVFQKHSPFQENFEQFFFWGDLLIKDFNDVDQYMADARPLFANLAEWKKLTSATDFLEEDQIALIEQFWSNFEQRPTDAKEKFQKTWDILYKVYQDFREVLRADQLGYTGMLYRDLAEGVKKGEQELPEYLVFAGFNALTKSEEALMVHAVSERKAKVFWDVDAYYADDKALHHEAGNFFREYRHHPHLGKTFPDTFPNRIEQEEKEVNLIEVSGNIGQAKLLGQYLAVANLTKPEKTAIILGDESLLFPVLNAIPTTVEKVNVTMGFPLKFAPINALLTACLYLQKNKRIQKSLLSFNHRDVLKILKHPAVTGRHGEVAQELVQDIEKTNRVRISAKGLTAKELPLLALLFTDATDNYFAYLKNILLTLYPEDEESIELGFYNDLYTHLARLEQIVNDFQLKLSLEAFIRLFQKIVQSIRVPFSGEPLEGLQLMGVLESRNLDFEEVHLLSMNEDKFPAKGSTQSFIPFNIRKAYGLPTLDQHDAIYAYLFYRLLHRSKKINIYYNTDNSNGKGGEASRFIKQLIFEANQTAIKLNFKTLSSSGNIQEANEITIPKGEQIKSQLVDYTILGKRKLSASAIKIYLDCRLKFYFKYLAGLEEPDEVQEELDAATFGNILHNSLEDLYTPYAESGGEVSKEEIQQKLKKLLKPIVEERFAREYDSNAKDFTFEGRNIIAKDMLLKMMRKILDYDALLAPFKILELEEKDAYIIGQPVAKGVEVFLDAKIDRLDKVGDTIRVIDYKSGGDDLSFPDVPSLFDRDNKKRNGAAMQTLFYSYLYFKKKGVPTGTLLQPGLYAGKFIFKDDFNEKLILNEGRGKKYPVNDALPFMEDFEEALNGVLAELFVSDQAFDQTADIKKCEWCPYSTICNR